MGVQQTIQLTGDGSELKRLEEITGGALPTAVIDATGNTKSMNNSFTYCGHTGRIVFVGIVTTDITFADPLLHRREQTLYASRNALPRDFRRIIRLIESGTIDTRPWITHRSGFNTLIDDFPSFTKPETGVIKAMVKYRRHDDLVRRHHQPCPRSAWRTVRFLEDLAAEIEKAAILGFDGVEVFAPSGAALASALAAPPAERNLKLAAVGTGADGSCTA